ncbi:hypothetical protein ACRCPG_17135, partial [Pseudomonas aeruginosa]
MDHFTSAIRSSSSGRTATASADRLHTGGVDRHIEPDVIIDVVMLRHRKRLANTPPRFFQLAAWCPPVFGGHHFKPL